MRKSFERNCQVQICHDRRSRCSCVTYVTEPVSNGTMDGPVSQLEVLEKRETRNLTLNHQTPVSIWTMIRSAPLTRSTCVHFPSAQENRLKFIELKNYPRTNMPRVGGSYWSWVIPLSANCAVDIRFYFRGVEREYYYNYFFLSFFSIFVRRLIQFASPANRFRLHWKIVFGKWKKNTFIK